MLRQHVGHQRRWRVWRAPGRNAQQGEMGLSRGAPPLPVARCFMTISSAVSNSSDRMGPNASGEEADPSPLQASMIGLFCGMFDGGR